MDVERFRYYTRWHEVANERRYDAPGDPWGFVRVNPNRVTHYNTELRLNWGMGRVQGGDWDRDLHCSRIRETAVYRGLVQRFEHGRDWEDTALYAEIAERFEERDAVRGYESLRAYREVRCAYLDDLFERIETDGYRPNDAANHDPADPGNAFETAYANHLEPLVVVGRTGNIYWTEGFHRFALAEILGVDAVPVSVLCRHESWQRVRKRVHSGARVGDVDGVDVECHHPDLQDVL